MAALFASCQRELELQPTPGQDVSTSLTGEIVFTVTDADAELLTKSSRAEEKSTISYGMIQQSDGNRKHIADITMDYEPLELPTWSDSLQTKADVTGLSSFYVTCVTGSAGSESQSWGNVGFSGSSTFSGGKYWPSSNLGYKFYASNASLSFASGGTTVAASNSTDVVVAYKTDATYYASSNSLSFSHIFGKLGRVTITTVDDKVASDVSITLTPKVSGTYNIRTGEWSGVSTGSAVNIAPTGNGYKDNNIYLVPGNYTINANWTLTKGASKSFSASTDITITAGYCSNLTITLDGTLKVWGSFGGYYISPAPLYYNGTSFEIKDDDWMHESQTTNKKGKVSGSYDFTFVNLGSYFDSRGSSFSTSSGNINNSNSVSYMGYDFFVPDESFYSTLFSAARPGSTVMGASNARYSFIRLTGVSYLGTSTPWGILLYPDRKNISNKSRTFTVNTKSIGTNTDVTLAQLNEYLQEGCEFLPQTASYTTRWQTSSIDLWTCTAASKAANGYVFNASTSATSTSSTQKSYYYSTRLIAIDPTIRGYQGLEMTPGNIYYDGNTFRIDSDWTHQNYGTYGKTAGSYYFSYLELASFFDSTGDNYAYDHSIDNNGQHISYGGHSDWRLPSTSDMIKLVRNRVGGTVNGTSGCLFANIRLNSAPFFGGETVKCYCYLFIPDNITLSAMPTITEWNKASASNILTISDLQTYINNGCDVLPDTGYYSSSTGNWLQGNGYYATNHWSVGTYADKFLWISVAPTTSTWSQGDYICVRLMRDMDE